MTRRRSDKDQAFVGLFAAAGTEAFYRRFGFEVHAGLVGMFQTTPITIESHDRDATR